jgi:hypothetical protein
MILPEIFRKRTREARPPPLRRHRKQDVLA